MTVSNKQNVDTLLNQVDALYYQNSTRSTLEVKEALFDLFVETETDNEWDSGAKKIQNQIEKLEARIGELEEDAQKILKNIEEKNSTVDKKSDNLADTAAKLTGATGELQTATENAARIAAKDAINSFKLAKGDVTFEECFNQAFMKRLGGLRANQAEIQALYELYEQQKGSVSTLAQEIESALNQIGGLESQLKNVNATISMLSNMKNVMENITSKEELDLVGANNIDLTETLQDGSPRYVFAPGKEDGKYHIYDLGADRGATLARQYASGGGYDIIQSGNGYIYTGLTEADSCSSDSETVFYLNNSCNEKSVESMQGEYKTCSPLSFDLNGDGVKTSENIISYDIDGDGVLDKINDSADAILVFDKDGDGISGSDGSECFGDNTDLDGDGVADGYKNGFEALRALALKDGLVNGADDNELDENDLKLLEEKYGLKIKKDGYNGEAVSLSEAGITKINLSDSETQTVENFDNNNNNLMTQDGATFVVNGEEREYADIWHTKKEENQAAENDRYSVVLGGQEITTNEDLSDIRMRITNEEFEKLFANADGSETIDNIKAKLEEMLEESKQSDAKETFGDVILTEDELNEITGTAYLNGIRDAARKAAEKNTDNQTKASDAAEEAVTNYWDEHINKNNKDKKED